MLVVAASLFAASALMVTMMQPQRKKTIYFQASAVAAAYSFGRAACQYQCPVDPSSVEKCSTDAAAAVHVQATRD